MRALKNSNENGELITINQACEAANLGMVTVRKIAAEAGAVRRFGRLYRINRKVFFDYIEETYVG